MNGTRSLVLLLLSGLTAWADPAGIRGVWVQQLTGEQDPRVAGNEYRLMAREFPGEPRVLLPGPANFSRPLISSDGQTVYYTDRKGKPGENGTSYDPEIYAVPFAGGEARKLGAGMAVAVWRDAEGSEFIYALSGLHTSRRPGLTGDLLVRFKPATPEEREIMWTESPLGVDNFQLSRDGTHAAGLFPWPQAGMADMAARAFTPMGQGSFPSMVTDDSYALAMLDADRRKLRVFVPNVEPGWELLPSQSIPAQGGAVNHLRWTNDPLQMTFSGPAARGDAPDVFVARLRPDLRTIEEAVALTSDPAPDSYPDAWVPGGEKRVTSLAQRPAITVAPAAAPWPATRDGLLFAWENLAKKENTAPFAMHGYASPGRNGSLNVSAGWAETSVEAIAPYTTACAAAGSFTMEALITERETRAPCSVRILSLRTPDGRDACALYRVDRTLVLRMLSGGSDGPPLQERHVLVPMAIQGDAPYNVFITVHAGQLQFYLDGQLMKTVTLEKAGLQAWKDLKLMAGDQQGYGTPWTGMVERIALYSRALAAAEISDAWRATQAFLTVSTKPTRCKVKAKLVEMPALPDPAALAANPRSLLATSWEVEQSLLGNVKPGRTTVLYWAWLDGKPAPLPQIRPGQSIELYIESIDDHPELRHEPIHDALTAGEQPVYFDTTPPGRHGKPFP